MYTYACIHTHTHTYMNTQITLYGQKRLHLYVDEYRYKYKQITTKEKFYESEKENKGHMMGIGVRKGKKNNAIIF